MGTSDVRYCIFATHLVCYPPHEYVQHGQLYDWLLDLAQSAGAELRFNTRVTEVDTEGPAVLLASGEVLGGDIVVGADGWDSIVRRVVTGNQDAFHCQSQMTYR